MTILRTATKAPLVLVAMYAKKGPMIVAYAYTSEAAAKRAKALAGRSGFKHLVLPVEAGKVTVP